MKMKLSTTLALPVLALGLAASPSMAQTPAPTAPMTAPATAPMKPVHTPHHAAGHAAIMAKKGTPAHDSMSDSLNAQSLAAAQSGQAFMPPGGPATPAAAPAMKKKM
jgi:hypothetical protein